MVADARGPGDRVDESACADGASTTTAIRGRSRGPFEESGADREVGDEIGDEGGRRVSTTVIDRDPEDLALP
ncbi:MAG TPA: hypothetical protein VEX57_10160 [Microlunatus sp.]|nr:hypothetical protein [Microlunatus sp.]